MRRRSTYAGMDITAQSKSRAIVQSLEERDAIWDQMATRWAQRAERLHRQRLDREQRRARRSLMHGGTMHRA